MSGAKSQRPTHPARPRAASHHPTPRAVVAREARYPEHPVRVRASWRASLGEPLPPPGSRPRSATRAGSASPRSFTRSRARSSFSPASSAHPDERGADAPARARPRRWGRQARAQGDRVTFAELLAFLRDPQRATVRARWEWLCANAHSEQERVFVATPALSVERYLVGEDRDERTPPLSGRR